MHQYCFILGHNPTLSVWEIVSVLNQRGFDFKLNGLSDEVMWLESDAPIRPAFLERLGGTIKIVEVIGETTRKDLNTDLLLKLFVPCVQDKNRIVFGFSVYPLDNAISRSVMKDLARSLNRKGLEVKKEFKAGGHSVRLVAGREAALSSIIVESNKLLEECGEWVFMPLLNKVIIGKTIASQKSFWYSWRDFGRPARDARSGMLPPKLAKILINLSGVDPVNGGAIMDPFCGSGTVMQEAGILGFKRLICFDRDPAAIERSQKNWQWLEKQGLVIAPENKMFHFKLADVRHLASQIPPRSVEAVVSEGYLGEPMGKPDVKQIHSRVNELSDLYYQSFVEYKKILKPGGRVVMTFPVYVMERNKYFLPIIKQISELGFKSSLALPATAKKFGVLDVSERGSVIYGRPEQKVHREVFLWSLQ